MTSLTLTLDCAGLSVVTSCALHYITFSRRFCPERRTRDRIVKLQPIEPGVTINTTLHKRYKSKCQLGRDIHLHKSFCSSAPTSTLEDVTAVTLQPGHVLKAQQSGVHPQARSTLPHTVHITGTHLGHQRNCLVKGREKG